MYCGKRGEVSIHGEKTQKSKQLAGAFTRAQRFKLMRLNPKTNALGRAWIATAFWKNWAMCGSGNLED